MMDNKNNFINAEIFLDNIIRKYKVETTSKYTISGRPLFEVSSKKEMSIVCSEIVDNHYLLDIKMVLLGFGVISLISDSQYIFWISILLHPFIYRIVKNVKC